MPKAGTDPNRGAMSLRNGVFLRASLTHRDSFASKLYGGFVRLIYIIEFRRTPTPDIVVESIARLEAPLRMHARSSFVSHMVKNVTGFSTHYSNLHVSSSRWIEAIRLHRCIFRRLVKNGAAAEEADG